MVKMRIDKLIKSPSHIAILLPAIWDPPCRQELIYYNIGEQHRVGAIGETYEIEIPLLGSAVNVGKILKRRCHRGVQ